MGELFPAITFNFTSIEPRGEYYISGTVSAGEMTITCDDYHKKFQEEMADYQNAQTIVLSFDDYEESEKLLKKANVTVIEEYILEQEVFICQFASEQDLFWFQLAQD